MCYLLQNLSAMPKNVQGLFWCIRYNSCIFRYCFRKQLNKQRHDFVLNFGKYAWVMIQFIELPLLCHPFWVPRLPII